MWSDRWGSNFPGSVPGAADGPALPGLSVSGDRASKVFSFPFSDSDSVVIELRMGYTLHESDVVKKSLLYGETRMKKLGILGGMGPESTILYYKEIVKKFSQKDPNGAFPSLSIETVNMYEMLGFCKSRKHRELTEYLLTGIYNLERSGADFIILASNTPHVVFEQLEERAHVPMLSIIDPTFQAIQREGYKKVAWLGTAFTMEQPFFRKKFIDNEIQVSVPNEEEIKEIDQIIARELEFGIVNPESKSRVDAAIQRLIYEEDIEAVIMGCTELPLMYADGKLPVPVFDTMQYHINGIVDHMFED